MGAILLLCENYQASLQYKKMTSNLTLYWKDDTKLLLIVFFDAHKAWEITIIGVQNG